MYCRLQISQIFFYGNLEEYVLSQILDYDIFDKLENLNEKIIINDLFDDIIKLNGKIILFLLKLMTYLILVNIYIYYINRKEILNLIKSSVENAYNVVFKEENEDAVAYFLANLPLKLEKMELIKGYESKADTMFVARFIKH